MATLDAPTKSSIKVKEPLLKLSTAGVAVRTAPVGLLSFIRFFLHHRQHKRQGKPTAQLSYAEGLAIVRRFLEYASTHQLSELQHFTANHVPTPKWVSKQVVTIPSDCIDQAASLVRKQLRADPATVKLVGGDKWWTMRGRDLTCEWIEMKKQKIKRGGAPPDRVLLYIHGGAHFFSSLETHRYQCQRHSRKANARVLAPSYRLSPQYPFPCALHDVLATYLFLLKEGFAPHQILFSGDSSGAGLALALLVLLRDQGQPLPAGATLISPWVDLAHSFPSVMEDDSKDYIPSNGFHYRPGLAWPPLKDPGKAIVLEGEEEEIVLDEQMQMYAPNAMLSHPMVSPVNQGSLGGLPPLYICAGSGELLRDEIIYIAHKAANPSAYPPSPAALAEYPSQQKHLDANYPPTLVQLQVYDDACHVATTLSITSVAKYMYRGTANFAIWALTAASKKAEREATEKERGNGHHHHHKSHHSSRSSTLRPTEALASTDVFEANAEEHSLVSESDSGSDCDSSASSEESDVEDEGVANSAGKGAIPMVRVTGHLPRFEDSMIRSRVSTTGRIRPLEPADTLPGTTMAPASIGRLHSGPVRKWLASRADYDKRYAKDLVYYRDIRLVDREKALQSGFLQGKFAGENPPLSSLAGWSDSGLALRAGESVDEIGRKTNLALASWARISQAPDEEIASGAVGGKTVGDVGSKLDKLAVGEEGEVPKDFKENKE